MQEMSAIPGRMRLHSSDLIGRYLLCRQMTLRLAEIDGVTEAYASHRTGRQLVVYNLGKTDKERLIHEIADVILTQKHNATLSACLHYSSQTRYVSNGHSRLNGFARDLVLIGAKTMLPAPWNTLLSMAAELLKRQSR
jgi:hypothetical protein